MFTKDNILLAMVVLVVIACMYLHREMKSAKADITTCKSFSVSLANRISSAPARDVKEPDTEKVVEKDE